jgi:hypothetical protein
VVFRNVHKLLVDTATAEYLFCLDFWEDEATFTQLAAPFIAVVEGDLAAAVPVRQGPGRGCGGWSLCGCVDGWGRGMGGRGRGGQLALQQQLQLVAWRGVALLSECLCVERGTASPC